MSHEDATEEVSEAELLDMFGEQLSRNLHVAMPVKVEAYDKDKQTVDVTPQLNRSLPDGAGNYVSEQLPKIKDVPVCFPRTSQFMMSFPIPVGDFGMLVVCDRNLAQWRATAAQGDPGDLALHSLDGAVFIPGLYPDSGASGTTTSDSMVLGSESNSAGRIELKASQVLLGGGAQFVALANKVNTELSKIATTLGTGSNTGGPVVFGTPYTAGTVDAANVKAT